MNGIGTNFGWGFAPGTFGELLQGEIDGIPFLVTLPVFWGTRATFTASLTDRVRVWPSFRKKAALAVERALAAWNAPPGGELVIQSTLPVGKGMASSTADMVAAVRAAAGYYGVEVRPGELARWAASVEPSDGIMYPFISAFNPMTGQLVERLGPVPRALVLGAMGFGRVSTVLHHRKRAPYTLSQQARLKAALDLVRRGLATNDVTVLAQAGLISAEVQYERTGDTALAALVKAARRVGVGVIVGHSGTVRGWLVPRHTPGKELKRLEDQLKALHLGACYRLEVGLVPRSTLSGQGPCAPLTGAPLLLGVEGGESQRQEVTHRQAVGEASDEPEHRGHEAETPQKGTRP